MKWAQVPAGDINAANQRLWGALDDSADEVATRIKTDPAFVADIAKFIVSFLGANSKAMTSLNPQWLRAREIMGRNFFGIEEAIKHFGVKPSEEQLAVLGKIPFSEDVLTACKDTHVLVAIFPMSILDVRSIVKELADQTLFFNNQDWYNKQEFANDKGEVGWKLIRKVLIDNSTSKTWNEQQALLSKDEETPKAQVVVYTMISHFLATGERLFEKVYVRCVDLDSNGERVVVGYFVAKGIIIKFWEDDTHCDYVGVLSTRK